MIAKFIARVYRRDSSESNKASIVNCELHKKGLNTIVVKYLRGSKVFHWRNRTVLLCRRERGWEGEGSRWTLRIIERRRQLSSCSFDSCNSFSFLSSRLMRSSLVFNLFAGWAASPSWHTNLRSPFWYMARGKTKAIPPPMESRRAAEAPKWL